WSSFRNQFWSFSPPVALSKLHKFKLSVVSTCFALKATQFQMIRHIPTSRDTLSVLTQIQSWA
ncbi:LOW QUALITY PROTEIN: hypothetical protein TorRG33x02_068110, partial [Trema orientale]